MKSKYNTINKIKEVMVAKGVRARYDSELDTTVCSYPPEVKLCIERSRLITQGYKETERDSGIPYIIRKAKAFSYLLDNMTVYIDPYQLIVGNETSKQELLPIYIEISSDWIKEGFQRGDYQGMLNDKDEEELMELCDYWQGKTINDRVMSLLSDDLKDYALSKDNHVQQVHFGLGRGRCVADFKILFQTGLKGRIQKAKEKLSQLKETEPKSIREMRHNIEKGNFYEAAIMSCEAVCRWAGRYARLATELAIEEKDEKRREELKKIAEVCNWVPYNPPRTFYEALQFLYFIHLAERLEFYSHGAGYRFDQVLYPFYKRDIEDNNLTRDEAQKLIECLWLKINDVGDLTVPAAAGAMVGSLAWQNLCIGGIKPDGSDATNELSYLMLDATMDCRAREPALVLRYTDQLPDSLVDKAVDLIATGHGMPSLFNDRIIIPFLEEVYDVPSDLARNYTIVACVRWGIEGKSTHPIVPNIGGFSALKPLELALNQGVDKFNGKQIGYPTLDPLTFISIEDVQQAYLKQIEFFAERLTRIWNIATVVYAQYGGRPFGSILLDDCLETGKESIPSMYREGLTVLGSGFTNVANSLAVIKKLVFEKKTVAMKDLIAALKNNWNGYEELRQRAINDVPKFGNDEPYVDEIMKWVHVETNRVFRKFKGVYGGTYTFDSSIASGYYSYSLGVGATPDGRVDREPAADASVSPTAGSDKKGPTALLNSVAYLNPLETKWNHLFNQRFLPQQVTGDNKGIFKSYLKAWSDYPIWHIQFNVVSSDTLRDAQQRPEKYTDLVVRVAGYSAYFVHLTKEVQDDIIRRTEQSFS